MFDSSGSQLSKAKGPRDRGHKVKREKFMHKYLLAATAAAILATPAFAADGPYVGIEGGVMFPRTSDLDVILNNTTTYDNGYRVDYKTGYDVDAIAGYKFGIARIEAEGGYKHAKVKSLGVSAPLITDVGTGAGATATAADFDVGNHIGILSLMGNALLDGDFGGGFGGYVGGGAGRAWAKQAGDSDNAWAYQGIAGLRYAVSPNIDAGLKYRYFRTGNLNFNDAFSVNGTPFTTQTSGHYASHSLLASLVYNFNSRAEAPPPIPAAAPSPPPPPPAPPATQTCPDGTVILATSTCPAPPPPPPPPAPAERGERG
jgi:opacity protein-like surface antigen